jgi:hypothetical protein
MGIVLKEEKWGATPHFYLSYFHYERRGIELAVI